MRKLVVLLGIIVVLCSLTALAKATYDFESAGDESIFVPVANPSTVKFTIDRSSDTAYSGDYSLRVILFDTTTGGSGCTEWNVYTAGYENDSLNQDITFNDDTLFLYMYLPDVGSGVMDNIQPFTQDNNWAWYGNQQGWGPLSKDQWYCYFTVIADVDYQSNPRTLPIKRCGVQFKSLVNQPACTLYIDYISTWGRYVSGIELITDPGKVTLEASINTIKFSLDEPTPVLLSVYNLMGAKVAEISPGVMSVGTHEMVIDAPAGMYIVKLVAGGVVEKNRLIIFK